MSGGLERARARLVGRWLLDSFELALPDGTVERPAGETPNGRLHYGEDGWLSVHVSRGGRAAWASQDFREATCAEALTAVVGYNGYAGGWEVVEADEAGASGELVHRVDLAWFPNWEGGEQRRRFAVAGDALTLSTRPGAQVGATATLRWRRSPGG
ncbi:MAG: lipocalin-like domain-containing protein [Thermoleophilia bacterium]